MRTPVIQKIVSAKKAFVERRGGKFLVKVGQTVKPYDFVAELKDDHRRRLAAGVPGKVVKLLSGKAVLLQTEAAIIRGVFGVGEDAEGEVRVGARHHEPIIAGSLSASDEGAILVAGCVPSLEVLRKAEAVGVRGIVCGGANRSDLTKTSLPVLLTEGFGAVPMNGSVFEFLAGVSGRHVFLSPENMELLVSRHGDHREERPDLFASQVEDAEPWAEVKVGDAVQIFSLGQFGQSGKVVAIGDNEVEVETDGGKITVPSRNVGIIK